MTYELKRVSIWSVAKISFVLGGVIGFIIGLFIWLFAGLIGNLALSGMEQDFSQVGALGLGAMGIVLPFLMAMFYAVICMIGNSIMTAVYNLFAGLLGGFELTLNAQAPARGYAPPTAMPNPYATPQVSPPYPPPAPPAPPGSNPPEPPPNPPAAG